jgi:hypothetical protein
MASIGSAEQSADAYARLGLAPGASFADVKRAYRRLAMDHHPDRVGSGGVREFLAIKAAYDWIAAHPSLAEPTHRRPSAENRAASVHSVWRASPGAEPRTSRAAGWTSTAGTGWAGGRWYWEGFHARAAQH